MSNRVCKILNIKKPIIQGPMAWISTAPLVAAVSNAGGLGVLGVGFAPEEFVREQIKQTRKLTNKPFGINTIMIPDNLEQITDIVTGLQPPVVYADVIAGLDEALCRKYFGFWHDAGSKVIVKASFLEDAKIADRSGADIIIVKGWEGGGHTTFESTMVLVPQAADAIKAPVVASGGIADGRGMVAAIALGAEAIEMGTIFMAASEVTVHSNVQNEIIKAGDMDTVITGYCTGEPCRQIKNKLSDELEAIEACNIRTVAAEKLRDTAESSLKRAMMEGDMEYGAVMAGQIVSIVTEVKPAADIIDEILTRAKTRIAGIQTYEFD